MSITQQIGDVNHPGKDITGLLTGIVLAAANGRKHPYCAYLNNWYRFENKTAGTGPPPDPGRSTKATDGQARSFAFSQRGERANPALLRSPLLQ